MNITSLTAFFRRDAEPAAAIEIEGRLIPVVVVRSPRARRAALRVDSARGEVRVTLPARIALSRAGRLVEQHRDWIAAKVRTMPGPRPIAPGGVIPFRGEPLLIDWRPDAPRAPELEAGRMTVGGSVESLGRRVERWLRAEALAALTQDTQLYAEKVGRAAEAVRVGDPAARWGSCSAGGRIAYSWRLILAPDWVRRSVAAHEVAHLVHLNHSPAFHALNRDLLGCDPAPARTWLAANGPALYWVGRDR